MALEEERRRLARVRFFLYRYIEDGLIVETILVLSTK